MLVLPNKVSSLKLMRMALAATVKDLFAIFDTNLPLLKFLRFGAFSLMVNIR